MARFRRTTLAGLGLVAALLAFEVTLQLIALVLWATSATAEPATIDPGQRTVLCVGDSFTWGLGAKDRLGAYPAVAERALAAAGLDDVRCLNLGWPGQDSTRVLARLGGQLARYRPELVYVLVGYNDFWAAGEPPPVAARAEAPPTAEGAREAFVFELRTLKLAKLIAAALAGGPDDAELPPIAGPWHDGAHFFDFVPDGSIVTANGTFDGVWTVDGARLIVELRGLDTQIDVGWRIDGQRLTLSGEPFGSGLTLTRGMPMENAYQRGIAARRAGDHETAERELRDALGEPEHRVDATFALARLLSERGRTADARVVLQQIESVDPARIAALVDACFAVGDDQRGLELTIDALRHRPIDDDLARVIVRHALRLASPALDRALITASSRSDLSIPHRVTFLGLRAALEPDPDAAIDALIEVARLQPDGEGFVRAVRWNPGRFPREHFLRRAARLAPQDRDAVVAAFDRAASSEGRSEDLLARNLTAIVATIRAAGALPILMTYPGSRQAVADTIRRVADTAGVALVDHFARFADLARTTPSAELFIADGHCNDRGYALMGEAVAADAVGRLR